jgi:hypothetical protein
VFESLDGMVPFRSAGTADGILVSKKTYLGDSSSDRFSIDPLHRNKILRRLLVLNIIPVVVGLGNFEERTPYTVDIDLKIACPHCRTANMAHTDIATLWNIHPYTVTGREQKKCLARGRWRRSSSRSRKRSF